MSLSLFLSVVTNHLIECTMNELKMDVTVHLITSAYDMGNKSKRQYSRNSVDSVCDKRFVLTVGSGLFSALRAVHSNERVFS